VLLLQRKLDPFEVLHDLVFISVILRIIAVGVRAGDFRIALDKSLALQQRDNLIITPIRVDQIVIIVDKSAARGDIGKPDMMATVAFEILLKSTGKAFEFCKGAWLGRLVAGFFMTEP
jgi:hypothetical protein